MKTYAVWFWLFGSGLLLIAACRNHPEQQVIPSATGPHGQNQVAAGLVSDSLVSATASHDRNEPQATSKTPAGPAVHQAAAAPTVDHYYIRNHWQQFVEVYSPVPPETSPPGIYNYRIKVVNKFPYVLDTMVLLVSYYVGGDCIATELLRLADLAPGTISFAPVSHNAHARTFRYQVRKVVCRGADLCFDIDEMHVGDDPFRCPAN